MGSSARISAGRHDGGAGNGHALALAAREFIGPVVGAVLQAVVAQRLRDTPRALAGATPASIIGSAMFSAAVRRGTKWKL